MTDMKNEDITMRREEIIMSMIEEKMIRRLAIKEIEGGGLLPQSHLLLSSLSDFIINFTQC